MQAKQKEAIANLVLKVGADCSEEDNLNAAYILADMLETKEFSRVINEKANIDKLFAFTLQEITPETHSSRNNALFVLNALAKTMVEKSKNSEQEHPFSNNEDEDDIIVHQGHDETEGDDLDSPLVKALEDNMGGLVDHLARGAPSQNMVTTFTDEEQKPLGRYRLRLVELIHLATRLHKASLNDEIAKSEAFAILSDLIYEFPWNNFMQLKLINVYEDILENDDFPEFRRACLEKGRFCQTLIKLSERSQYNISEQRQIRHGHMAFVIRMANVLLKCQHKPEVKEHIERAGEEWQDFMEGEFKEANEMNSRNLGGQQPKGVDDDENSYEVTMENIMQRFDIYNKNASSSSTEEEEEEEQKDEEDVDLQRDEEEAKHQGSPEQTEFMANNYWRMDPQFELDDLLADYETA